MKIYKLVFEYHNLNKGVRDTRCVGVFSTKEELRKVLTEDTLKNKLGVKHPETHLVSMLETIQEGNTYRYTDFYPAVVLTSVYLEESILNTVT